MNEENERVRDGLPEPSERTGLMTGHDEADEVRAKAADALQVALDRRDNGGPRHEPAGDFGHPD